nr:ATP-binding cassette domain-containing protein [Marinomonas algarum]
MSIKNKLLLNEINLSITEHQCVVCVGKSGAGKSSLLQLLAGIFPAEYTGKAMRFGEPIKEGYDPRVGWLPQGLGDNLNPHMTIEQHLTEGWKLAQQVQGSLFDDNQCSSNIESIIAQVSLSKKVLSQHPKYLSGGEIQRVLLALALISKPSLLLLDEPTASLDQQAKSLIMHTLKRLKTTTTIFIVTHDHTLVNALADDVLVMESAEIINNQKYVDVQKRYTESVSDYQDEDHCDICSSTSRCFETPVVNIENLFLKYQDRVIFRDFSVSICKNTTTIIYGESGQGKTTLAKIIAGWDKQADQFLSRFGSSVYLSQHPRLACSPHFSLKRILTEPLLLKKMSIDMTKVREWLKRVSLPTTNDFLSRKSSSLSGGELQRLLIVRAMLSEPDLLIADEPTSALDPSAKEEIIHCFKLIKLKTSCSILIFTHDLELQSMMGERGFMLTSNGLVLNQ